MEMESLKKILATVEKTIQALDNKNDFNPSETQALLNGMQLRELLLCELEDCKRKDQMEEYAERGYSRHDHPYRRYNITAYGGRPTSVMYSGDRSYYDPYYDEWDSRDMYYGVPGQVPHGSVSTRGGYSRHSIGDRVVEKLEQMMDGAGSDYEKEELHKFIRMIRQAAD